MTKERTQKLNGLSHSILRMLIIMRSTAVLISSTFHPKCHLSISHFGADNSSNERCKVEQKKKHTREISVHRPASNGIVIKLKHLWVGNQLGFSVYYGFNVFE